jgi:hypothetical protein
VSYPSGHIFLKFCLILTVIFFKILLYSNSHIFEGMKWHSEMVPNAEKEKGKKKEKKERETKSKTEEKNYICLMNK